MNEEFKELVISRLKTLGYEAGESDTFVLAFLISKVENHIKDYCNITEIPDNLKYIFCDIVCGEFLNELYALNKLGDNFNLEQGIKTITEGDTTITFMDADSDETKLKMIISALKSGEGDLICYRKIRF